MKKVISLAVCCATVASFGQELIKNGTFAAGTTNWQIYDQQTWYTGTANTNFSVINGEAVIIPESLGQFDWESDIYQDGLQLVQGKTYECSFDLRKTNISDRDKLVSFSIKADYAKVGNISYFSAFNFGSGWSKPTFRFKMINPTDNNATLHIMYGNNAASIIVDNVTIKEVSGGQLPSLELYSFPHDIAFPRPTFGWDGRAENGISNYKYSVDGGTEYTTTATSITLSYDLAAGDHTFSVWPISTTGARGYGATSNFKITGGSVPVTPQTLSRSAAITVTTNSNGLQINTANNSPMELSITNVAGRVLYSSTVTPSNNIVSVPNATMGLASGVYMLSIKDMAPDSSPICMKISL